jgi:hypothetical protein
MRARDFLVESEEMSTDDMDDFLYAWVNHIEGYGVCNEVYAEPHDGYGHLFIGGYPEDGFTEEVGQKMAKELDDAVREHGWFVAKCEFKNYDAVFNDPDPDENAGSPQLMCFIDVFPMFGEEVTHEVKHSLVYHASNPDFRKEISASGLRPHTGGSDHITTAQPRLYVMKHKMFLHNLRTDMRKLRGLSNLDLWEIDLSLLPDHRWYEDVEYGGAAAWTTSPIPPHAMRRIGTL